MRLTIALALLAASSARLLAQQQPATALDTVRVTVSSRTPAAAQTRSVRVITRQEIERSPARNVAELLATALGMDVQMRSPASADLSIRGSSLEQVLVLVDGQRMTDQQSGHFDLDLAVPLDVIDHVEVLRGPGSTLYGPAAVGGVIDIVTRPDVGWSRADVHAGSFGTVGASAAGAGRVAGLSTRAGLAVERSDGHRDDTDYRTLQGTLSAERALGEGRVRADAGIGVRDFGAGDFYGPYRSYEDTHATTAALRWDSGSLGAWSLGASAATRRHGDLFTLLRDQPAVYQNHHVSWQSDAEAVARRTSGALALVLGADGSDLRLRSARLGNRREQRGAGFGELSWGASGAVLRGGVRGDWSSVFGGTFSPSLSASVPLSSAVSLRASVDRGFREPTWTERYYQDPVNVGDPALAPERFWAGEVGARASGPHGLHVDAATYLRRATDLIDWARPRGDTSGVWRSMNVERATYQGLEVETGAVAPLGVEWTARGSWLAFDATGASGYTGKYALRPATRSLGGSVSAPLGPVRLTVTATDLAHPGEASYLYAVARLALQVGGTRVTLDALNLANADYLDAAAEPAAGHSFFVGIAREIR